MRPYYKLTHTTPKTIGQLHEHYEKWPLDLISYDGNFHENTCIDEKYNIGIAYSFHQQRIKDYPFGRRKLKFCHRIVCTPIVASDNWEFAIRLEYSIQDVQGRTVRGRSGIFSFCSMKRDSDAIMIDYEPQFASIGAVTLTAEIIPLQMSGISLYIPNTNKESFIDLPHLICKGYKYIKNGKPNKKGVQSLRCATKKGCNVNLSLECGLIEEHRQKIPLEYVEIKEDGRQHYCEQYKWEYDYFKETIQEIFISQAQPDFDQIFANAMYLIELQEKITVHENTIKKLKEEKETVASYCIRKWKAEQSTGNQPISTMICEIHPREKIIGLSLCVHHHPICLQCAKSIEKSGICCPICSNDTSDKSPVNKQFRAGHSLPIQQENAQQNGDYWNQHAYGNGYNGETTYAENAAIQWPSYNNNNNNTTSNNYYQGQQLLAFVPTSEPSSVPNGHGNGSVFGHGYGWA